MSKTVFFILLSCCLFSTAKAAPPETYTKKGFTLVFESQDALFPTDVKQQLINTFFRVYPKMVKAYNKKSLRKVQFVIDTSYKGVAATSNGRVVFSAAYMKKHPADIDVVTHEVMHIVQDYGKSVGPWWLTEGIADYVRFQFGVDNAGAGWSLPEYKASQKYSDGYRVTAKFLVWVEQQKKGTIKKMNQLLHDHTYTQQSWTDLTGKSLDELWTAYTLQAA